MDRYSFDVELSHLLLHAGLPAHLNITINSLATATSFAGGPESRQRNELIDAVADELPAERLFQACHQVAISAATVYRALAKKKKTPRGLLLVLGCLVSGLCELTGRRCDSEWPLVLAKLRSQVDDRAMLYAAEEVVKGLDEMWWDLYESSPLFVAA